MVVGFAEKKSVEVTLVPFPHSAPALSPWWNIRSLALSAFVLMDPVPKSAQLLAPGKKVQKRPSNEALETQGSKKQHLVDDRTSHAAVLSTNTDITVHDPHISVDEDIQSISSKADQVRTLQKKSRVYREPNRKGETEKSAWGRCCECENSGQIMSWPKCRSCLHNRCQLCEYSEESTTFDGEEGGERSAISARFDKMKEFSGEIWLELEALGADETLTSKQSDHVGKVVEALNILNQSLSEAEAGGDGSERGEVEQTAD